MDIYTPCMSEYLTKSCQNYNMYTVHMILANPISNCCAFQPAVHLYGRTPSSAAACSARAKWCAGSNDSWPCRRSMADWVAYICGDHVQCRLVSITRVCCVCLLLPDCVRVCFIMWNCVCEFVCRLCACTCKWMHNAYRCGG